MREYKYTNLAAVCFEVSSSSGVLDLFLEDLVLVEVEATGRLEVSATGFLAADDGPAMDDGVETTNWLGVVMAFQETF